MFCSYNRFVRTRQAKNCATNNGANVGENEAGNFRPSQHLSDGFFITPSLVAELDGSAPWVKLGFAYRLLLCKL
jgi:hypothetical protein